jgi:hypothetical protein
MKTRVVGLIVIAIFMYIVLTICSIAERSVSVAVGSHYSPSFAAQIQQVDDWRAAQLHKDPAEAARTGHLILLARRGTRAAIALLVAAFIVWIPRFKKGREPNTALQPTATAHSVLD